MRIANVRVFSIVAAVTLAAPVATLDAAIIDDFEGYADTPALQAVWLENAGGVSTDRTVETAPASVHGGTQSMRLDYHNGQAPWYTQFRRAFDTPLDLSGDAELIVWYLGLGSANSAETLRFELLDVDRVRIGIFDIPNGTQASAWTQAVIPLAGFTGGSGLANVGAFQIGLNAVSYGDGTLWIDEISTTPIPEPAALGMLSGVGIALLRRRRGRR